MDPEIQLKVSLHGTYTIYATAGFQVVSTAVRGNTSYTERSEPQLPGGNYEIMYSVRN